MMQNKLTTGPNANAIVSQYDYTVNAIGQRTTRTQSGIAFDGIGYAPGTQLPTTMTGTPGSGTSTDIFNYNTRGEVINSTNNIQNALARSYSYDPIGNRLNATEGDINNPATNPNAKTYSSNSLNQYTQINTQITTTPPTPPTTAQPTYDDDGNMLTDGTGKTYTWDCENRLIQVTLPNSEIVKYYYDATSRCIKREHYSSNGLQENTRLYDYWNVIEEKIANTPSDMSIENQGTTKAFYWGLDLSNSNQGAGGVDGLLASRYLSGEVFHRYNHAYDGNGNTSELLDTGGYCVAHYKYDPFGRETQGIGIYAVENLFRFSTKVHDPVVELTYFGFRFLSAQEGRWLGRDPLGEMGGFALYNFTNNNSINSIDILGLEPLLTITTEVIKEGAWEPSSVFDSLPADPPPSSFYNEREHYAIWNPDPERHCDKMVCSDHGGGKVIDDRSKTAYITLFVRGQIYSDDDKKKPEDMIVYGQERRSFGFKIINYGRILLTKKRKYDMYTYTLYSAKCKCCDGKTHDFWKSELYGQGKVVILWHQIEIKMIYDETFDKERIGKLLFDMAKGFM